MRKLIHDLAQSYSNLVLRASAVALVGGFMSFALRPLGPIQFEIVGLTCGLTTVQMWLGRERAYRIVYKYFLILAVFWLGLGTWILAANERERTVFGIIFLVVTSGLLLLPAFFYWWKFRRKAPAGPRANIAYAAVDLLVGVTFAGIGAAVLYKVSRVGS